MARALSDDQVTTALEALPRWRLEHGALRREYTFADFSEAFAFLTRVALVAEKKNHHPDIHNSWSAVTLDLSSHDAGGVTQRDVDLAAAIDDLTD
jgi:4a-hydroxytetrahydrobiopterin dehydratase